MRRLSGTLTFISSAAEPGTRSFRIEVEVDNPERLRVAGSSATVRVHLPPVMAHRVSPAVLALDEDGRLGVPLVDEREQMVVAPVRLLSVDNEGAWITGIGERVRLITRRGAIELMAREDRAVSESMVFVPFAFVEAAANVLTNPALDPFGKIPEFKFAAVRVEKATDPVAAQ